MSVSADAILFDLDDTLVVDDQAVVMALMATCMAAEPAVEARALFRAVWAEAHRRYAGPEAVALTPMEALMVASHPDTETSRSLREGRAQWQLSVWEAGLAAVGGHAPLARVLCPRLRVERNARLKLVPGALEVLAALRHRFRIGLVSNGSSELQRHKLHALGLAGFFDVVVISEEVAIAKPGAAIYERALAALGATAARTVMIGDDLQADVEGAAAAGIHAVWLPRGGTHEAPRDVTRIAALAELESALAHLTAAP